MKINFVGENIGVDLKRDIKRAVCLCLETLKQEHKHMQLCIAFISEADMKDLNKRTRGVDKVTDVLSFPNFNLKPYETIDMQNESNYICNFVMLGDMAICLKRAESQAYEFGNSTQEEVIKLVIHSVLHLMGFDHIKDEDYEVMKKEEEQIARKFYTIKKI